MGRKALAVFKASATKTRSLFGNTKATGCLKVLAWIAVKLADKATSF